MADFEHFYLLSQVRIIAEIFPKTFKGIKLCIPVRQQQDVNVYILPVTPKVPSVAVDYTIVLLEPQKRASLDGHPSFSTKAEHSDMPLCLCLSRLLL